MDGQLMHRDEGSEIQAYLEATRELENARILEEAEFIRDLDLAEDEEPDEGGDELQGAPVHLR